LTDEQRSETGCRGARMRHSLVDRVLDGRNGCRWFDYDYGEAEMNRKVTVVGAGNVGATLAQRIADRELADVVLVDVVEGMPQGKGLDMLQAGPIEGSDARVLGTNDYASTAGSDVVVITAGIARKPGMSRDDLLATNKGIVQGCTENAVKHSPNAILIIVSNPLDAMCHVALKASGFPHERVFGMAGVLDSARMRAFIAQEVGVSVDNVHAFVLGGHGDTMVPLPRYSTVAGIPLPEVLPADRIEAIVKRTAGGGAEIVGLLKTGSAYYAPSAAAAQMVEAVLKDTHTILPCSCHLDGQFGIKGLYVGVPAQLGAKGVEKVWEIKLTDAEAAALKKSSDAVKELVEALKL
jgi:malate dehydrogenase